MVCKGHDLTAERRIGALSAAKRADARYWSDRAADFVVAGCSGVQNRNICAEVVGLIVLCCLLGRNGNSCLLSCNARTIGAGDNMRRRCHLIIRHVFPEEHLSRLPAPVQEQQRAVEITDWTFHALVQIRCAA
jgi:hypothetical protein